MARALAAEAGCYEAWRAAALSGVPVSTVYYWARTELIVPSISPTKEMLWSYGDLMALRIVSWLRHTKRVENGLVYWDGQDWTGAHDDIVRRSPMHEVRRALALLDKLDLDIWRDGAEAESPSPLLVDRSGKVWIRTERGLTNTHGQWTVDLPAEFFNLLAPFELAGHRGPNLLKPRPSLRIVPLKVAGEPHVVGSRITSRSLVALHKRGFESAAIADMYGISPQSVGDAIDLENQLSASALAA
jgi:uncharacterized protein (DUF433 family)